VTVYSLHALTGILGPARMVTAMSGIGVKQRRWKQQTITVEMDDNTLMLLDFGESTFAVAGGQNIAITSGLGYGRLAFFGTEGSVEAFFAPEGTADQSGSLASVEIVAPKELDGTLGFPGGTFVAQSPGDWPHVQGLHRAIAEAHGYADIMHLIDCLTEHRAPIASAEHGRHVVEIIEAAYRSARSGQAQRLTTTFGAS